MMRVGLVEDNADFRAELAFHLKRAGMDVVFENDGFGLDQQLDAAGCDVLVLDLGLPTEDGLQIAQRLRQRQLPLGIVMLTARAALDDRLHGLEQGADAYLVKPVDMRELVATLKAVHRRLPAAALATAAAAVEATPSATSAWVLRVRTLSLQSPQGQPLTVSPTEMALLRCMAEAAPDPVSRERLAMAAGHHKIGYDDRWLEVAFSRLRRKIEATQGGSDPPIRAARGRGYVFAAPVRIVTG